ncbi:hypothetical protein [Corynebacterium stationis]|uniref:hypothetical protein n=1 Tax=Corynebacterium stationis TaxID=1705 RepID=UPI00076F8EBF|nr:hypothetical protein [Corynebacterium stationis]AMJ44217.1 hypothetical protein AW169_04325 [Corynebacterium stationis]AQX70677.1 hypothetical protein CA21670_03495 [Corynebacterium stationis]ASJ18366.1 hypothetical protein BA700_04325 [Corynebacterium stationis]
MGRFSPSEQEHKELQESLIIAYRKAKADVYYQSADRRKLLGYERKLEQNLKSLLAAILEGSSAKLFSNPDFTGTGTFAPKSIDLESKDSSQPDFSNNATVYTSPLARWEQEVSEAKDRDKPFTASFRLMSDCGIGLHVLSALWVKYVGAEIEQRLFNDSPYANRIRRTRNKEGPDPCLVDI